MMRFPFDRVFQPTRAALDRFFLESLNLRRRVHGVAQHVHFVLGGSWSCKGVMAAAITAFVITR